MFCLEKSNCLKGKTVFSPKVEMRDQEIERLVLALDGGRSHDIISLESRSKSNEKLIAQLNLQVTFIIIEFSL